MNTVESLAAYVTADDAELTHKQFLFAVATRILDDLKGEYHAIEEETKICIACNGSGYYDVNGSPPCSACNGTGRRE